jgi:UDP-3-O-[3-hydroxymyristoyl] glucosamine N-acyltransferase
VAPLDTAGPEHISFLGSDAYRSALAASRAGAVIVGPDVSLPGRTFIRTPNPYAYFIRVAKLLNPERDAVPGVHGLACVHPDASVAASAEIGPFVTIEAGASIGEGARVGPNCFIGTHATIGPECFLHRNVTVYPYCLIGARAVINAGAVIGSDGFGGALDQGEWLKMPHIGRVVMGDDVEVGANTTIDRGAMGDTVIADGVKLDNQIQIGHNVHIGRNTTVAGCVGIAGSARIGADCVINGAAMITGHLHLVDGVTISVGTVVTRSIDKPGRYSGFYPLSEHRAFLKGAIAVRRLADSGAARTTRANTEEDDDNAHR